MTQFQPHITRHSRRSVISAPALLLLPRLGANAQTPSPEYIFRFPWFEASDNSVDPAIAFGGYPITINLFEGLVKREDPTQMLGAERADSSDGGRVWTFKLKSDREWSDGAPLTAGDYEYGIKRYVDPETAAPLAFFSYYIKGAQAANEGVAPIEDVGVRALDDQHLEIEFDQPIGFAPALLSLWGFWPVPRHAVEQFGPAWTEPENIVVNGPFTIASWEHGREMVLVPNQNYQGVRPAVDRVVLPLIQQEFQTSDGVALRAYENDETDYAEVPFAEIDRVKADAALASELHFATKLRPVWINFDTANEPWSDSRVRHAFALAVDRQLLAQTVFKGTYQPISTLVPPSLLPDDSRDEGPVFDLKAAQELLTEAGFPSGQGFPEFTLQAASNSVNELLAPALQEQWRQNLGITSMRIELLERQIFDELVQTTYQNQPFDLTIGGLTADFLDPAAYFDTWLSTRQEFWNNHWVNTEYDRLVTAAGAEPDLAIRATLYAQAHAILVTELPGAPLWLDGWGYMLKPTFSSFSFAFSNFEPKFETVVPKVE